MKTTKFNAIRGFVVCLAILASTRLRAAEINVFAAASLTDALREIAAAYEKGSGDKIVFNFGASSTLARQLEEGAPADIFFSADEAKMDGLEKKGLILKETRKSVLSNSLVIVVATQGGPVIESPEDLATDKVKRLALAEPNSVPAGIYAKEYLIKQGLWGTVKAKVIPTENVRAALAAVEAGNVEAGIVYKTDAAISQNVKVALEIPPGEAPEIRYPVAVVRESRSMAGARKFAEYLDSDDARKVFQKHGFILARASKAVLRREGLPLDVLYGPLEIVAPDEKVHSRWVRRLSHRGLAYRPTADILHELPDALSQL